MRSLLVNRGSVLIMALWALVMVTVFAVQISVMTRDKISFLARAERQSLLRSAAQGAIYKAIAVIKNEQTMNVEKNPLQRKMTLNFNPSAFQGLNLGQVVASVIHLDTDGATQYGVTDEWGKLNINFASREAIQRLIDALGVARESKAGSLASALYDWREYGESEIKGFASDQFYDNLEFPYSPKKRAYETLDELKLIEGMTEDRYEKILPYISVFGAQRINMNEASWPVLFAYGLTEEQARMVATIRKGDDGIEGTLDDVFLTEIDQIVQRLEAALGLDAEAVDRLWGVLSRIPFRQDSRFFRIHARASLPGRPENKSIICVFDLNDDKIIYWREF